MKMGIWGDSITYGGPSEGWVGLLRKFLASTEVEVYNRGICGDTSKDILKRFGVESGAINPKTIIFAVGVNDSKYPHGSKANKVALVSFEENMDKLVELAITRAKRVIIIGLTEVDEMITSKFDSKFLNNEIYKYDDLLRGLASKRGLEFVQMRGCLDLTKDLEDGIHPNNDGYTKMFELISGLFK